MKKLFVFILIITFMFTTCSKKQASVDPVEEIGPPEMILKADELYALGDIENAFLAYGVIYERYPTSTEYIDASLGLSRCYNDMGDYEKGMNILYNLVNENIIPSRVPEIYNEMAKYYEINAGISSAAGISDEARDYEKAMEYYQKAIYYPNSQDLSSKAYAQYRIGELNINMLNFKEAILAFKTTSLNYPNTAWAKAAEERMLEFKDAVNNVINESGASSSNKNILPVIPQYEENSITDTTTIDTTATDAK